MVMSERACGVHDADDAVAGRICGRREPCSEHGPGGVVEGRQRALDRVEGVCRLLARAYGERQPSVVGLRALQELLVDAGLELGRASLSWESGEAEEVGHGDE